MVDVAWCMFEEALAARLATLSQEADRYLIVEAGPPPFYIQYSFADNGDIYNEAVSNTYLVGKDRLTTSQQAKLRAFGWLRPGEEGRRCDCRHPSPPNYHRSWLAWQGWRIIAQVAVVTFSCVYGISYPTSIVMLEVPYDG